MFALKYRPKNFQEFIGNETPIKGLISAFPDWPSTFLFTGPPGIGKAQPNDEIVLTPKGWEKVGNIKIGDDLYGSQGIPIKVIGVFPQGEKKIYKIFFNDNSQVECCGEHLWKFYPNGTQNCVHCKEMYKHEILDTKSLIKRLQNKKSDIRLPQYKPINFPPKKLSIDPYALGVLIGDGSFVNFGFSTADNFILQEMKKRLKVRIKKTSRYDYRIAWEKFKYVNIRQYTVENKFIKQWKNIKEIENELNISKGILYECLRGAQKTGGGYIWKCEPKKRQRNIIKDYIEELGLTGKKSYEKFIPKKYLLGSIEQRKLLLQGLCDTDGYTSKTTCQYYTSSPQLCKDVIELVKSLGGRTFWRSSIPTYTYKGEKRKGKRAYVITIAFNNGIVPNLMPRKRELWKNRIFWIWKKIEKIEYSREAECTCFLVDAKDHLYITRDYTLTHNTTLARLVAKQLKCEDINIKEVDAGQDRGIDNIRQIIRGAHQRPLIGKTKVYIFDECQGLTMDAQQALLKITEESPKNTYFIFCSTDPHKIIKALKARCQHGSINLLPLADKEIGTVIKTICKEENIELEGLTKEIAKLCVYNAEGIPRNAVMLFNKFYQYDSVDEVKEELKNNDETVPKEIWPMVNALDSDNVVEFIKLFSEMKRGNYESFRITFGNVFKKKLLKALSKQNIQDIKRYTVILSMFSTPVDNNLGDIELIHRFGKTLLDTNAKI